MDTVAQPWALSVKPVYSKALSTTSLACYAVFCALRLCEYECHVWEGKTSAF